MTIAEQDRALARKLLVYVGDAHDEDSIRWVVLAFEQVRSDAAKRRRRAKRLRKEAGR